MIGHGQLGSCPVGIVALYSRRTEVVPLAAELSHGRVHGKQGLRGHGAECDDDFWFDGGNLPHEEWRTGFAFFALGSTVSGRTALDDVRDVDLLAAQAHGFDHVGEELPGASDERFALLVLVGAGGFADKHQVGLRIADAEDDLLASLLVKHAASAVAEVVANDVKGFCGVALELLGLGSDEFSSVVTGAAAGVGSCRPWNRK